MGKKKPKNEVKDEVPKEAESAKPIEEKPVEKPEEVKEKVEPQFKNNGKDMKIKLIEGEEFKWITVRHGEVVTIPRKIALANKLVEVK